jgi:hypothetical protein
LPNSKIPNVRKVKKKLRNFGKSSLKEANNSFSESVFVACYNVSISASPADVNSQFGLLGALVIQSFTNSTIKVAQPPQATQQLANPKEVKKAPPVSEVTAAKKPVTEVDKIITAYPNPFHDYFTISVPSENNTDAVQIKIIDINGNLVYSNQFGGLYSGINVIKIETGFQLTAGVYFVQLTNAVSKSEKMIKLEKE